jgi:hypothetical protein
VSIAVPLQIFHPGAIFGANLAVALDAAFHGRIAARPDARDTDPDGGRGGD